MQITFHKVRLKKRFPLAISRGIRSDSENLFVRYEKDGIIGWGEAAPGKAEGAETVSEIQKILEDFVLKDFEGYSIQELYLLSRKKKVPPCAYVGLDIALWDWKAKKAGLPLYKLLGFPRPETPTSVTIGINTPEVIRERIPLLLEGTTVKSLKIKLGSPDGIEVDKAMFEQVVESSKNYNLKVRVDANGGWKVNEAKYMMRWLADRKVDYIEQPLKEGEEYLLKELYKNRPIPIFLDESCRFSENIPRFSDHVDGVNIKLMKCGGITEALKIIETAQKYKLKTMIGCMSESSVSIAAAAALSGAIDHIDLDSHFNLAPDPSSGAPMVDGVTLPPDIPGHGGELKQEFYA